MPTDTEPTCRRGDRSTKFATANPSYGGLSYAPQAGDHYHEPFLLASGNPVTLQSRKMKMALSILLLVLGILTPVSVAQVATNPDLRSSAPLPPATPSATEPKIPERSQIDEIFKQTSLGKEADEQRMHIEMRQLQNQVINDADVIAAKRAADTARTDLEKRERLRDYYNLYYGRMRVLARSAEIKTALDQLKTEHLSQLTQAHVRHQSDSNLPTPSPTPKKKKQKKVEKFRNEN